MSLRIIGGDWKSRKIEAPAGKATRPLLDRIKQSLFDTLGQRCDGETIVDACAGSGSFGFEAASRGATTVHLCEVAGPAFRYLQRNHQHLGSPSQCILHQRSFVDVLPKLTDVDLCFCDPPFPWFQSQDPLLTTLLELAGSCIAPQGLVVMRGERGTDLPLLPGSLHEVDRRKYGRSWIAFLRRTS